MEGEKHRAKQSTMSSKLQNLRATLKQLEDCELPDKYQRQDSPSDEVQPVLDEEVIQRFKAARNDYKQKTTQQIFFEQVGTWDGTSFQMPSVPTEEEQKELKVKREEVQRQLSETITELSRQTQLLQNKCVSFRTSREELSRMIHELEEAEANEGGSQQDEDDTMSQDVDEEEMALEEQRLANLTNRKAELEAQLRGIRHETTQVKVSLEESQIAVSQMLDARGGATEADGGELRTISPETIIEEAEPPTLEQVQAETADLQKRTKVLREMSEWYAALCSMVEELGGIKNLSVEEGEKDVLLLHMQLLGKHEIQVGLVPNVGTAKRKRNNQDELHVSSAKFLTETLVTAPSDDQQDASGTVVQMRIPPLDDLVRLSANLGPVGGLQFLLRETMSRIKTITARVSELGLLLRRTRYLTRIGESSRFDYGFGGENQEIVCSLNEGVTVVLQLSPDCPMVDGSVYVDQIVGTGGWDQQVIDQILDSVNSGPCRGPLMLMDALVKEIERLKTEEGLVLPRTPSMPARKAA